MQHNIYTSTGARRLWTGERAERGGASLLLSSSEAMINPRMLHSLVKKKRRRKITKKNIDPVSDELQTGAVNPCACVRAYINNPAMAAPFSTLNWLIIGRVRSLKYKPPTALLFLYSCWLHLSCFSFLYIYYKASFFSCSCLFRLLQVCL